MDPIDPVYLDRIFPGSIPGPERSNRVARTNPVQRDQQSQQPPRDQPRRDQGEAEDQDEDFYEPSDGSATQFAEADAEADSEDVYEPDWRQADRADDESIIVELGHVSDAEPDPRDNTGGGSHIDISA